MKMISNLQVRTRLLPAILLITAMASGCATITRGSNDVLVIESEPSGAEVKLSSGQSGKTPTSFTLPRKQSLVADITKDGYEPVQVNINPAVANGGAAGMAGNVLVGGLIGVAVDAGTGAMYDLRPNPVKVTLVSVKVVDEESKDEERRRLATVGFE